MLTFIMLRSKGAAIRKVLLKSVMNAIFALFLLGLIKIVAMFMLKEVNHILTYIDIAISLSVVIVLLKFMMDFNHQLKIASQDHFQVLTLVPGLFPVENTL